MEGLKRPDCFCGFEFSEPIAKDTIAMSNQPKTQDLTTSEHCAAPSSNITRNVNNLLNNPEGAESRIIETLKLLCGRLNDDETDIALNAAKMVHQYSRDKTSCHAIISNSCIVTALVRVISDNNDLGTVKEAVSTLHHLSHHRTGMLAIFWQGSISALVDQLSSPIESIVFDALTTLHNVMWHQAEPKSVICSAGGISQLIKLLPRNNVQLLRLSTYCLSMLANDNLPNQVTIIEMDGVPELLRILRCYGEEELLYSTLRALMVLLLNARNRRVIVRVGGMQTLAICMLLNVARPHIVKKCLWSIYQLSDAIAFVTSISEDEQLCLLKILLTMLGAQDVNYVKYAVIALNNLTNHVLQYRELLCQTDAVTVLINTIINTSADRADIIEMAVRILGHLTIQHDLAEMVRDAVRLTQYGIRNIVHLLITSKRWSLVKAVVRLISNLALSSANCAPLRKAHAIHILIKLMKKAEIDLVSIHILLITAIKRNYYYLINEIYSIHFLLFQERLKNKITNKVTVIYANGVTVNDIIEETVWALHILGIDASNKVLIGQFDAIPILVRFLSNSNEGIQVNYM